MARYIKCPRCELNYVDADLQEYCDICLDEMKGTSKYVDLPEDEEETELCPICGENMMKAGEKMCDECKKKFAEDEEEDVDLDKDEAWRDYMDDETEETLPDAPDADEFEDEEEEEEDDLYHGETDDDFDYVTADEAAAMAFDDDDEEEEDKEDDDF
ncbi:MAG: hypothetical protein J5993_05575 [Clostridia bacterium]|nr:hypothetical protein [Clostridia bacterium]